MFSRMYEPFRIGNTEIRNRLVCSAMFERAAADGKITEQIAARYRELAEGGAGLIVTGMQAVRAAGRKGPNMVTTDAPGYVEDMGKICDAVHRRGAKIFVQLQHCGAKVTPAEGYDCIAVSGTKVSDTVTYHEASREEIKELARDFGAAAARCQSAGADGVQIHCTHGYLLNTFLSPSTNHRTDEYGGPIENRARILFEVYESVREAVGEDYPVAVKFSFSDLVEHSITPEESLFVLKKLADMGIDMEEISSGMVLDHSPHSFAPLIRAGVNEGPFRKGAAEAAEQVSIPVVSVCGYRSPDFIEKVLETTKIAAVSFGRPLVCEPDLPNRWMTDPSPAACVSCNLCARPDLNPVLRCVHRQGGAS